MRIFSLFCSICLLSGFVLFGLSLIVGISLLYTSRRLKEQEDAIVLEPISNEAADEITP